MSVWLQIMQIIPALIAAIVSGIIFQRQEKTKKEIEELRHDLSKEMFFTEKQYSEKKLLYLEILEIEDNISVAMEGILMVFQPKVRFFNTTLVYIFDKIKQPKDFLDWKTILQKATEDERNEIEELNYLHNLESFRESRDKLLNMRTRIWLFSSREINDLWWCLIEISKDFQNSVLSLILSIANEAKNSNSEAEIISLRNISFFKGFVPITENIESIRLNLISSRKNYIEISTQMLDQMREELHFSED